MFVESFHGVNFRSVIKHKENGSFKLIEVIGYVDRKKIAGKEVIHL